MGAPNPVVSDIVRFTVLKCVWWQMASESQNSHHRPSHRTEVVHNDTFTRLGVRWCQLQSNPTIKSDHPPPVKPCKQFLLEGCASHPYSTILSSFSITVSYCTTGIYYSTERYCTVLYSIIICLPFAITSSSGIHPWWFNFIVAVLRMRGRFKMAVRGVTKNVTLWDWKYLQNAV